MQSTRRSRFRRLDPQGGSWLFCNSRARQGITFIASGHLDICIVMEAQRPSQQVGIGAFLLGRRSCQCLCKQLPTTFFMVAAGNWTTLWEVSVFGLLGCEILGCALAIVLLGGWLSKNCRFRSANHHMES